MTTPPISPTTLPDLPPVPFGVHASTGEYLPGFSEEALEHLRKDSGGILRRAVADVGRLGLVVERDADKLDQAGWGILFPATLAGQDVSSVRQALAPLLDLRRREARDLYREFRDDAGYTPGTYARDWLEARGSALASVDPAQGVPYYLLLVGSPQDIPFDFQFELDTFFAVGRLYFDKLEEYAQYAQNMVDQEAAASPLHDRSIALVAPRNPADKATAMFHDSVATTFLATGAQPALGSTLNYSLHTALGADATKSNVLDILHGTSPARRPALLISGSHGVAFDINDPDIRHKQGAMLTQDWAGRPAPVLPKTYITGADVASTCATPGMIHFFFACYSAACPAMDTYSYNEMLEPTPVAPTEFLSRLPQTLLLNGAQAVIGHVDRVWANSFQNSKRMPTVQKLRDPIVRILQGHRVGDAMDNVNQQWAGLAAVLSLLLNRRAAVRSVVPPAKLAGAFLERDDARNYIVIGDPAAHIRMQ
jgi:hypothetical protein